MPPSVQESLRAETVVAVPPIEVWQAFIRPAYLDYWLGHAVEVDLRVGGAYVVRASNGMRLDATVEKMIEGRRLVLRPTRRGDDARVEIDLVKLGGAETRILVTDPDPEAAGRWREALENLRSVWERGVDLREARTPRGRSEPPPDPERLVREMREEVRAADERLEKALEGLSDADAYRPEKPEAWSVAQVLAHLSVVERALQCWLDQAARGERPVIESEAVTGTARIAAALEGRPTVRRLVERLQRDERETLHYLESLPRGVATFKPRWARLVCTSYDYRAHSEDHLGQIARIRATLGV